MKLNKTIDTFIKKFANHQDDCNLAKGVGRCDCGYDLTITIIRQLL